MNITEKLESVREDIKKGLKSKAMNRLQGLINAYPNEIIFREELGGLYLSVDWKEKAGLHLLLTKPRTEEEEQAIQIYRSSVNHSGHKMLVDLKFKGDKKQIHQYSNHIIEELEQKILKETNVIPKFVHSPPNKITRSNEIKESWKDKLEVGVIIMIVACIPILMIIGLIQVLKWIF